MIRSDILQGFEEPALSKRHPKRAAEQSDANQRDFLPLHQTSLRFQVAGFKLESGLQFTTCYFRLLGLHGVFDSYLRREHKFAER